MIFCRVQKTQQTWVRNLIYFHQEHHLGKQNLYVTGNSDFLESFSFSFINVWFLSTVLYILWNHLSSLFSGINIDRSNQFVWVVSIDHDAYLMQRELVFLFQRNKPQITFCNLRLRSNFSPLSSFYTRNASLYFFAGAESQFICSWLLKQSQ